MMKLNRTPSRRESVRLEALESRMMLDGKIINALSDLNLNLNAPAVTIDLTGRVGDSQVQKTVVDMNYPGYGSVRVALFDDTAPQTVANFYHYINTGRYDNTIMHRWMKDFVLQGGGFTAAAALTYLNKVIDGADPNSLTIDHITTYPPVVNEFGASNLAGTVAMAKTPDDPNSATSEFFYNLANNASNLDNQNGGFTVFGQILGNGLSTVVQSMTNGTTVKSYNAGNTFTNIPMKNFTPGVHATNANVVVLSNVTAVPILPPSNGAAAVVQLSVASSDTNVVTASLDGSSLRITPVSAASGASNITLTVTGANGVAVTDTFTVYVNVPRASVGAFRDGKWFLDANASWSWNAGDLAFPYGKAGDVPITGDWNGDGYTDLGLFRNGKFILDLNGNRVADASDVGFVFGLATDIPVAGDWNGDGKDDIGIFRSGRFILDANGDRASGAGDVAVAYGLSGDLPVAGEWTGTGGLGTDSVGIFRRGNWAVDANDSRSFNAGDIGFTYGLGTDKPIVGDWNRDGVSDIGVFRGGKFILDANGSRIADAGDVGFAFGLASDVPITGRWKPAGMQLKTITAVATRPTAMAWPFTVSSRPIADDGESLWRRLDDAASI